jgi:PAS domain S-box-containing protein
MEKSKKRKTTVLQTGEHWLGITVDPVLNDDNNITGAIHVVSDITERKRADEALRLKNLVFDVSIAANSIANLDGIITEANNAFLQNWGYTNVDDVVGKPIHSFLNDEGMAAVVLTALNETGSWKGSYTAKRKDGTTFIAQGLATVMRDENGKVAGYQSSVTDVTESKRAEEEKHELLNAVVQEKNKLSALIDSIADEVWFTDTQGKFTLINPSALREFSLIRGEEIEVEKLAKSLEVLRPDGSPRPIAEAQPLRALTGEVIRNEEEIVRTPESGALKYRQVSSSPVRDADGSIMGAVSIVHDITELKRLEESFRESQRQYRNLVEGTSDLVTRVNADGCLLFVNHAMQEIYGLAPKDCIGRPAIDLIHPEDRESTKAALQSWLNSDMDIFFHDNRMLDAHGRIHHLAWSVRSERDDKGKIIGFASMARDITERKKLESEKTKLEEQNRHLQKAESLGRMSGSIAHLFNNQLQVVMGYLEMVIGDLPPGDSRAVKLTTAAQATRKASEVSSLLLAYLGQTPSKLELLDLSELCRKSIPLIMAGKPLDVVFETHLPSPGPCISADAKQAQQLLTNLAINAWEAIGGGTGTIRLSVKTVSHKNIPSSHRFPVQWIPQEQQYACLEVTDTGCGISENDIDKIFDPFFTTKFTGRGLGLSVVYGIVRAHDSVITVESGINGLTVFRVFFPLSVQIAQCQNGETAKDSKVVLGDTVLLVEDNDAGREMTRIFLVSLGFKVIQAQDGFEAVEVFKKHKDEISWLFCDLTMPRMGGWDTISALRAIRPNLPVVLASGYDEARVMMGDHSELPDLFLHKPYGLNKLRDMVGHPAVAIKKETGR